jgi:Methyltransferase domain
VGLSIHHSRSQVEQLAMSRTIRNSVKRLLAFIFAAGQRLGFDILPRHFYSEIPDLRKLRRTKTWRSPYSMLGVAGVELDGQLAFARTVVTDQLRDRLAKLNVYGIACERNGEPGFGPIEADFLFAFVASQRPSRIVQIGCGVSTAICLMASEEVGYRPDLLCIDPYPSTFLKSKARDGAIRLIPRPVEQLDYSFLDGLGPGDLFFVDSTHTLGPAGEVTRIILEMLPRLGAGTRIHFHDVWFPYDYSANLLRGELFFWHETALLLAYLTHNRGMQILTSLSMLHFGRQADLRELLPNYRPRAERDGLTVAAGHYPCSIYLEAMA